MLVSEEPRSYVELHSIAPAAQVEWEALLDALEGVDWVPCQVSVVPDAWFATTPRLVELAVEECAGCPAVDACRAYAIVADEREGVWGGTTALERRLLAGRRR